jgi:outer membrane receptor protein involved in Fe transport
VPGLPGYASVDVLASRDVGAGITAFAGAQNLFNQRIIAGTLPTTVASPRMVSVGIRWRPDW